MTTLRSRDNSPAKMARKTEQWNGQKTVDLPASALAAAIQVFGYPLARFARMIVSVPARSASPVIAILGSTSGAVWLGGVGVDGTGNPPAWALVEAVNAIAITRSEYLRRFFMFCPFKELTDSAGIAKG